MYKLLLVDDEARQVKALENIISRLKPQYEIFKAENGQEALSFLRYNSIDILMTDIKMPMMDGLELIEKLSETGQKTKIVILSGYEEFSYAQKAIRFNVHDYLVKPVSKNDLQELLDRIEKSLEDERKQIQQQISLKQRLDNSLPVYLEHQLNKWVRGKLDEEGCREISSIFSQNIYGAVFIMDCHRIEKPSEVLDQDKTSEYLQRIKFAIKNNLKPVGHTISFPLEGYRDFVVTIISTDHPFKLSSYTISKRLNDVIKELQFELHTVITLGLSHPADNICANISACFHEAFTAIEKRFFTGLGKIIYPSDPSAKPAFVLDLTLTEEELAEAFRRMDKNAVLRITGKTFEKVDADCCFEPERFKEEWMILVLNQMKCLYSMMTEEEYHACIHDVKEKISRCRDYKQLWHCINRTLGDAIDLLNSRVNSKNSIIIEKCKKFMDENFMRDLSLESVAQKYSFNPSYFSNLFKNHLGVGFSEYLIRIRMEKAQALLKSSGDSMADIAEKVGFHDPTYFNRVFKRQTGYSPLRYRKMYENRMD